MKEIIMNIIMYSGAARNYAIESISLNNDIQFSLLLVHSQDHLMTTMTFKELAVEIIELH